MTILEHQSRKNHRSSRALGLALLGIALTVPLACSSAEPNGPATADIAPSALTDAEIVGVATALNVGEVDLARFSLAKTVSPEVRAFSEWMIKDHTAMQERVSALGVPPAPSALRGEIEQEAASFQARLANLEGPAFDKQYIEAQVKLHERTLSVQTQQLIPSAQNPAMKEELRQAAAIVEQHLQHARRIQAALMSETP